MAFMCPSRRRHLSTVTTTQIPHNPVTPLRCSCIPAPHLVSAAMLMLNEGAAAVKDPRTVIDNVLASLGIHPFDSSVDLEEFAEALSQMVGAAPRGGWVAGSGRLGSTASRNLESIRPLLPSLPVLLYTLPLSFSLLNFPLLLMRLLRVPSTTIRPLWLCALSADGHAERLRVRGGGACGSGTAGLALLPHTIG